MRRFFNKLFHGNRQSSTSCVRKAVSMQLESLERRELLSSSPLFSAFSPLSAAPDNHTANAAMIRIVASQPQAVAPSSAVSAPQAASFQNIFPASPPVAVKSTTIQGDQTPAATPAAVGGPVAVKSTTIQANGPKANLYPPGGPDRSTAPPATAVVNQAPVKHTVNIATVQIAASEPKALAPISTMSARQAASFQSIVPLSPPVAVKTTTILGNGPKANLYPPGGPDRSTAPPATAVVNPNLTVGVRIKGQVVTPGGFVVVPSAGASDPKQGPPNSGPGAPLPTGNQTVDEILAKLFGGSRQGDSGSQNPDSPNLGGGPGAPLPTGNQTVDEILAKLFSASGQGGSGDVPGDPAESMDPISLMNLNKQLPGFGTMDHDLDLCLSEHKTDGAVQGTVKGGVWGADVGAGTCIVLGVATEGIGGVACAGIMISTIAAGGGGGDALGTQAGETEGYRNCEAQINGTKAGADAAAKLNNQNQQGPDKIQDDQTPTEPCGTHTDGTLIMCPKSPSASDPQPSDPQPSDPQPTDPQDAGKPGPDDPNNGGNGGTPDPESGVGSGHNNGEPDPENGTGSGHNNGKPSDESNSPTGPRARAATVAATAQSAAAVRIGSLAALRS